MSFEIKEHNKPDNSVERSNSFDPDKRIDVQKPQQSSASERFDPDKRIKVEDNNKNLKDVIDPNDTSNREIGVKNKEDGIRREQEVHKELTEKYPEKDNYKIISEAYLRDENGKLVKDPETGEARRVDFVVVKDGKVVDSVEVTSQTADKTKQTAKEERIRNAGGEYVKDDEGNLCKYPDSVKTRVERKD